MQATESQATESQLSIIDVIPPQAATKITAGMAEWQKEWMAELVEW